MRLSMPVVPLVVGVCCVAAAAGVWDARSDRYWRELVQSSTLTLAEAVATIDAWRPLSAWLAKRALKAHVDGASVGDAARAAGLLASAGRAEDAALIRLGLANEFNRRGELDEARREAKRARKHVESEGALVALVLLHRDKPDSKGAWLAALDAKPTWPADRGWPWTSDARSALWGAGGDSKIAALLRLRLRDGTSPGGVKWKALRWTEIDPMTAGGWMTRLRDRYPESELVRAADCRRSLTSFEIALPAACTSLDWTRSYADAGRASHNKISDDIATLPARAAQIVGEARQDQVQQTLNRDTLRRESAALAAEREAQAGRAVGEFLLDLLPLPKEGDTLSSFIIREGGCMLPLVRLGCATNSGLSARERMTLRRAEIDATLNANATLLNQAEARIARLQGVIEYWRSSAPLMSLVEERAKLLPAFQKAIEGEAAVRFPEPGLPMKAAIAQLV